MNAELTELVFILDRSGSMNGLESDTIGGFNGMIAKQKAEGEQVNVTTLLFDDEIEVIHDRFPIEIIEPLTEKDYFVRGCTALLDAVGEAIKKTENVQNHLPETLFPDYEFLTESQLFLIKSRFHYGISDSFFVQSLTHKFVYWSVLDDNILPRCNIQLRYFHLYSS